MRKTAFQKMHRCWRSGEAPGSPGTCASSQPFCQLIPLAEFVFYNRKLTPFCRYRNGRKTAKLMWVVLPPRLISQRCLPCSLLEYVPSIQSANSCSGAGSISKSPSCLPAAYRLYISPRPDKNSSAVFSMRFPAI